jgi:hypothetical protein
MGQGTQGEARNLSCTRVSMQYSGIRALTEVKKHEWVAQRVRVSLMCSLRSKARAQPKKRCCFCFRNTLTMDSRDGAVVPFEQFSFTLAL